MKVPIRPRVPLSMPNSRAHEVSVPPVAADPLQRSALTLGLVLLGACASPRVLPPPPHLHVADPLQRASALLVAYEAEPTVEACPRLRSALTDVDVLRVDDAAWLRRAGHVLIGCDAVEPAQRLFAVSLALEETCEARVSLAMARVAEGNIAAAEARLRQALVRHPTCTNAALQLSSLLRSVDRPDEAVMFADGALRSASPAQRPEAFDALALAFLAADEVSQASLACEQGLHIAPHRAASWNTCGLVDLRAGRIAEGLARFERAYTLQPELVEAWLNHAQTALHYRDYESAERLLAEATRHRPKSYDAHVNRGVALRALGRARDAREHYERALELAPQRPDAHYNLALLLHAEGRTRADAQRARMHFERFLELVAGDGRYADEADEARARLRALP